MKMKKNDVVYVDVDDISKDFIEKYINENLSKENPYLCDESIFDEFAICFKRSVQNSTILKTIRDVGKNIPLVFFSNLPSEPDNSILAPLENRGYNYSKNENDRQKKYFHSEWVTGLVSCLFKYKSVLHPSEHGGNNRFHLISPIPNKDNDLREVGASTGGGKFYQHSDATVYTKLKSKSEIISRLSYYGTNIENVETKLNKTRDEVFNQILCNKYVCVDATLLKGILNVEGKTLIGTPYLLQKSLIDDGFRQDDFYRLSKMPIAHLAGPADGVISGFVGEITQPIYLDDKLNILGTCINSSENRMVYVGNLNVDEKLFLRFLKSVRDMELIEFTLYGDNLLLIPNRYSDTQSNYTHGRTRLSEKEYNIPVGNGVLSRRMHCRQYVKI